ETNEANNEQNDLRSQHQILQQNKKFSITEETDNEIDNEITNNESLLTHDGNVARRSINSALVSRRKQQKLNKISKRYTRMESIMEGTDEE
ncbi:2662_t:CDS:2, partial [Diversispora eburnea]